MSEIARNDSNTDASRLRRVFIGLGSNVGNRLSNLAHAVERLSEAIEIESLRSSHVYETRPIGPTGDSPFLNSAIQCATSWDASRLLELMQRTEFALGRRPPREGPRPIDLDLLFYGDDIWASAELRLPHPRLHERDFVLQPLADLDPNFTHPVLQRTIRNLLDDLIAPTSILRKFAPGIPGLPTP